MFVSINRSLRRCRRRLLVAGALLFVSLAVVTAHSALGGGHMKHGDPMTGALAVCLAIVGTATAMFVAAALGRRAARPDRFGGMSILLALCPGLGGVAPGPRSRAGPQLQVFLM